MENLIKAILQYAFPKSKITRISIMERPNGELTMSAYIDKDCFFMSGLPRKPRSAIYKLLNETYE